jgi:hypothetical protein
VNSNIDTPARRPNADAEMLMQFSSARRPSGTSNASSIDGDSLMELAMLPAFMRRQSDMSSVLSTPRSSITMFERNSLTSRDIPQSMTDGRNSFPLGKSPLVHREEGNHGNPNPNHLSTAHVMNNELRMSTGLIKKKQSH